MLRVKPQCDRNAGISQHVRCNCCKLKLTQNMKTSSSSRLNSRWSTTVFSEILQAGLATMPFGTNSRDWSICYWPQGYLRKHICQYTYRALPGWSNSPRVSSSRPTGVYQAAYSTRASSSRRSCLIRKRKTAHRRSR